MKNAWKHKTLAVLAAALLMGTATPVYTASAAETIEPDPVKVVALGDDVLAGTAANYVADYYGGTAVSYASVGNTTTNLLTELADNAALQQDLAEADVILLSTGVNDLVEPVWSGGSAFVDASTCETLDDVANAIPTNDLTALSDADKVLTANLVDGIGTFEEQFPQVIRSIRSYNASANLVVQSINNPMGVDFPQLSTSQNRRNIIIQLYSYLDVALEGGTVLPSLTSSGISADYGMNDIIADTSGIAVSDYYAAYVGAEGEKAIGFLLSNIRNLDMTGTPVGEVLLASSLIRADEKLTGGDGTIIAAGYENSGSASELQSMRTELDALIQSVGTDTDAGYTLCDVTADGVIDTTDAFYTLQEYASISAGASTTMHPVQRNCADVNGSNTVDTTDAFYQLMYYAQVSAGRDVDLDEFLQTIRANGQS